MEFDFERVIDQAHRTIKGRWKLYCIAGFTLLVLSVGAFFLLKYFAPEKKSLNSRPISSASASISQGTISVHITGAIVTPGVYQVSASAIGMQLVEQAGGFKAEADQHSVNLARKLEDGQQLHIPAHGEQGPGPAEKDNSAGDAAKNPGQSETGTKVNLNKASQEELEKLPKVGPAMAKKIIAKREEKPFTSLADLDAVEGVGPKMLEGLKDSVTF